MASGKLSPRQKMINLMYLIFIAMLAIQIGPEVLSSFGYMNEKFIESNQSITEKNTATLSNLATKSVEQPEKYATLYTTAKSINDLSTEFETYLEGLKTEFTKDLEDKNDYESMSGTNLVNEYFFKGDASTEAGNQFVAKIDTYREDIIKLLGGNTELIDNVKRRFDTSEQETADGKQPWLNNRYEGFPLISTVTNLTSMQSDIKTTESEIFETLLGGQLESDVSLTNYEAIVVAEKSAFFAGERFKGKIYLGKKDPTLKAESVEIGGTKLPETSLQAGQVLLDFPAGRVGENDIKGKFVFMENGAPVEIPISSSYAVIPKPNSAVISADKMNVVYRGVDNPMTISIPGVPDNKVAASATGMRRAGGAGKYLLSPQSGKEVRISVTGTLSDGTKVSSSQNFRIKDIPAPMASVRRETGVVRMPKASLEKVTVGAELKDFVFDLKINVSSFKIKVPGQNTVVVNGTRLNSQAKRALAKAKRGDMVNIFDVKAKLANNSSYNLKNVAPVTIELN